MYRSFEIDAIDTDCEGRLVFRDWEEVPSVVELVYNDVSGKNADIVTLDKTQLLQLKKSIDIVLSIIEDYD